MSTCLVYDDRRRARDLLGRMVAAVPGVHRVVAVATVEELLLCLTGEPGQVVIIGTQRAEPGGTEAVRRVLAVRPDVSVVVFGSRDDAPTVRAAVAVGARAFLRWDASPVVASALIHAITGTASVRPSGARPTADGITHSRPTNGAGPRARTDGPRSPAAGGLEGAVVHRGVQVRLGISGREMQVLSGMSEGMSNAAIGRELYLSDNTVKSLARRLFRKLGVHERAHAVARAYRLGLFAPSGEDVGIQVAAPAPQ